MAVTLAHSEYGAGAPLLILHGLFGSARNWEAIAKRLAETHHVYALDLRNHGNSPWADSMSYLDLVDDVRGFIEKHGLEHLVVLGHSMGGKTAMLVALRYQHLVDALIVVDVAPVRYQHSFLPYVQAMQEIKLATLSRRDEVDSALREQIPDAATRMFLLQNLVYRDERFSWRLNLAALAANMQQLADFPTAGVNQAYFGKTLIICGAESTYVRPEHHNLIYRLSPNAGITVIPNAGHWVHVDQPDLFLGAIAAFL